MSLLNRPAYAVEKDKLIYDATHLIDASAVQVTITKNEDGTIKRGQLLDFADGAYSIHTESGEASAIVAEDTAYVSSDTSITAVVYISGAFRMNEVIADTDITAADIEALRSKGIYLK